MEVKEYFKSGESLAGKATESHIGILAVYASAGNVMGFYKRVLRLYIQKGVPVDPSMVELLREEGDRTEAIKCMLAFVSGLTAKPSE